MCSNGGFHDCLWTESAGGGRYDDKPDHRARGRGFGNYGFAAIVAVVGRNPVAPPKLAGNAPVAYVLHPVIIGLVESLGHEFHFAALNNVYRGLCKGLHAHEPLLAHQRLNRAVASSGS
mgnify:CR=1 FL=1